jgi:cyclopropane-fatty-acyl-phospholipid synthase
MANARSQPSVAIDVEGGWLQRAIHSRSKDIVTGMLRRAGITVDGPEPWDIHVTDDRFYAAVLGRGSLGAGESYMDGWWHARSLDGAIHRILTHALDAQAGTTKVPALKQKLVNLQTRSGATKVATTHYDLGNDFFERMLGRTMAYSCGYWRDVDTLDEAQDQKMDLVCRKLDLQPGDRVLDIGCGWGSFAKYAAERYGARVTGITISEPQRRYAEAFCAGLPVTVHLCDYRDDTLGRLAPFDKIVSIGMFEHVGAKNHRVFMERAHALLPRGGLLLLHTIGNRRGGVVDPWVDRYIFPNSVLPSPVDITRAVEDLFVMEDWHNFGADYDRTLVAWLANFERDLPAHGPASDPRFQRMWRYYLMSFAAAFRARDRVQLWQIVLAKGGVGGGYRAVR